MVVVMKVIVVALLWQHVVKDVGQGQCNCMGGVGGVGRPYEGHCVLVEMSRGQVGGQVQGSHSPLNPQRVAGGSMLPHGSRYPVTPADME